MKHPTYLRYEVLRTFRNRRFLIFSLGFPLLLFLVIGGTNRKAHLDGIPFPLYYMTGMAAWGTMVAVISSGARIAAERQIGWARQMRITPLATSAYFQAKVLCGYLMALLSLVVLYAAGTSLGVRLSAGQWLTMTALVLVGLIPFAVSRHPPRPSADTSTPWARPWAAPPPCSLCSGGPGDRWRQVACS